MTERCCVVRLDQRRSRTGKSKGMGSEVDNSPNRLIQVYFYGLYLDPEVLRGKGVEPRSARPGLVTGRVLRIGRQATLLRSVGGQACGVVYSMTHDELERLYAGLADYRVEPVLVWTLDGDVVPALCCTLLQPPGDWEGNAAYTRDLREAMVRAGLPGPFPELSEPPQEHASPDDGRRGEVRSRPTCHPSNSGTIRIRTDHAEPESNAGAATVGWGQAVGHRIRDAAQVKEAGLPVPASTARQSRAANGPVT